MLNSPGANPAGTPGVGVGNGDGVGVGLALGVGAAKGPILLAPVKNDKAAADSELTAGLSR